MGGEAYISFKPDLYDQNGEIAPESTRAFLRAYIENLVALAAKLS